MFFVCIAATAVGQATAAASSTAPVLLRLKFNPDDVFVYSMRIEVDGHVEMENSPFGDREPDRFYSEANAVTEMKVKSVGKTGDAEIEGKVKDWKLNFNGTVMSAADEKQPGGIDSPMKSRLSKPFSVRITTRGATERMGKEAEEDAGEDGLSGFAPTFDDFTWTTLLPEGQVKIGDTWFEELPPPFATGNDARKPRIDYKFIGFENVKGLNCAVIEIESDLGLMSDLSSLGFPGMPKNDSKFTNFSSSLSGKMYLAMDAGVFVGLEFIFKLGGDMEIKMPQDKPPLKMTMSMEMNGLLNLE